MRNRVLLGCGLPLVLMGLILFVGARRLLKPTAKVERSETVQRGDVEVKVIETGTIQPLRTVEVKSKVGGRISKLFVDAGAVVRQGQTLASIDPQEVNSQVAALRAQLAGAQARLAASRKTADYQQSQTTNGIDQYLQNVQVSKARLAQVEAEAGAQPKLTRQSIDIAAANLEAARAALRAQQASLSLLLQSTQPQAIVAAQSGYDQARAQSLNDARSIQRQQQLLAKGFVSQQSVDAAETQAMVSEAHLRDVKAHLDHMKEATALEEANVRAQLANAQSQVRQAEAALAQAQTNVLPLTKARELDSARAAYQQAVSQLTLARSGKTQDLMRRDESTASAAEVQQIQNQLNEILVRQNDTTLIASMPGVITKRYVEEGELITSAIGSFSSGTPIFQLSDLATMLVKINVNEVDIAKLKLGLLTEVTIDAARGVVFVGHIRKVAPAALTDSNQSGQSGGGGGQSVIRFPTEIRVDHADPRLKPGMSARCAMIVARRRNTLRLPSNCISGKGATGTVQIVTATLKDGQSVETTAPRSVTVGLRGDGFVEILGGLKQGDKVRPNPYTGPPRKTIDINGPD